VRTLAQVGGAAAAAELAGLVSRELAFWRAVGPTLPANWAGLPQDQVEQLEDRRDLALEAVRGLRRAPSAEGRKAAAAFRAFCRSSPQLRDYLVGPAEGCDRVLAASAE
jgi:hypothetical protein